MDPSSVRPPKVRPGRRFPRVEVDGELVARVPALGTGMPVRNVSLGGVSTSSLTPLKAGETHSFEIALGTGPALHFHARIIYCRRSDDHNAFRIGWAWDTDSVTEQSASTLMNYLTDAAAIESGDQPAPQR